MPTQKSDISNQFQELFKSAVSMNVNSYSSFLKVFSIFNIFWYYQAHLDKCLAGFWIRLCYITYLFENLPVPVKHEFYLASSLWKLEQIPGMWLQRGYNIVK